MAAQSGTADAHMTSYSAAYQELEAGTTSRQFYTVSNDFQFVMESFSFLRSVSMKSLH